LEQDRNPADPKEAQVLWRFRSEADALRKRYTQQLGDNAVLAYDPTTALERLKKLPVSHAEIMKSYNMAGRWGTPWQKLHRGQYVDGTGGNPNPAINDSCLNISFEAGKLMAVQPDIDIASLKRELAFAVVEWANAFTGESVAPNEPICAFSVNGDFYSRLVYRARSDWKTHPNNENEPFPATAQLGPMTVKCSDFVRWEMSAYNAYVQSIDQNSSHPAGNGAHGRDAGVANDMSSSLGSEKRPGLADNKIDLAIRFVERFTIDNVPPDAVAIFVNTDGYRGAIEILAKPGWIFLCGGKQQVASVNGGRAFHVRNILLHELGHYFGLAHLPEARAGEDFLSSCAMCSAYSKTMPSVTPADAALANAIEYLSLDVRGRICAGLSSN
jgi:hypothetical protein